MEEPEVLRNSAIGMLKELGLTTREAEIYLTILQRGKVTMKDLMEALDIHQPQLYNVLASLARKGLIRVSVGRPKVYIANDPRSVVETRIAQLEALGRGIEECLNRIKKYRGDIEHAAYISVAVSYTHLTLPTTERV